MGIGLTRVLSVAPALILAFSCLDGSALAGGTAQDIVIGPDAPQAPPNPPRGPPTTQSGYQLRTVWREPRIVQAVDPARWVRLAPGAVLALEITAIDPHRLQSDAAVSLPHLGTSLASGTIFVEALSSGGLQACTARGQEPRDPVSGSAVRICLKDLDDDRRYERLLVGEAWAEITPIALTPLAESRNSQLPTSRVVRRLRVEAMEAGRVSIRPEMAIIPRGGLNRTFRVSTDGEVPSNLFTLPLRYGANASFAGVRLEIRRAAGGAWWVRAEGHYAWGVSLRESRTVVDAGYMILKFR